MIKIDIDSVYDYELMKSLEYKGEYVIRYKCADCKYFKGTHYNEKAQCSKLPECVKINGHNNICRNYEARIKNPSSPEFNFDNYLEFLGSDYYRPYSIDKTKIIGSAKLGEVVMDGGKLVKKFSNTYSPFYNTYDKPYCKAIFPRCFVSVDNHNFEIDYRLYREQKFINKNNEIKFVYHYWKDSPNQKKYKTEINGKFKIE